MAPNIMTRREAADYLGVTPRTVDTYIRAGKLRATWLSPRCVRLDVGEVQAFAGTRKHPA